MVPWKLYDSTTKMCPYVSFNTVVFARHVVRSETSFFLPPVEGQSYAINPSRV